MSGPSVSELKAVAERLREVGDAKSEHTIASYERRVRQWQAFAGHYGFDPNEADPHKVAAFALARYRAGVSARRG